MKDTLRPRVVDHEHPWVGGRTNASCMCHCNEEQESGGGRNGTITPEGNKKKNVPRGGILQAKNKKND